MDSRLTADYVDRRVRSAEWQPESMCGYSYRGGSKLSPEGVKAMTGEGRGGEGTETHAYLEEETATGRLPARRRGAGTGEAAFLRSYEQFLEGGTGAGPWMSKLGLSDFDMHEWALLLRDGVARKLFTAH